MAVKKELIVYPDERIFIPSTDVREFNKTLCEVIEMMKEVIEEHGAEGLAAIQTGYPYQIVIIKTDDGYLELINPRIIASSGKTVAKEQTLYYPNIEIDVPRHEVIRLVYQDREGHQHNLEAKGALARVIQRKIDYTFAGTFLSKVDKKTRQAVEKALSDQGLTPDVSLCPLDSKKEYFISVADKVIFLMFLTLFGKLFDLSEQRLSTLYTFDKIGAIVVTLLLIGYFVYGRYEAKRYTSCTSCQIGNMIGAIAKRFVPTIVIVTMGYFIIHPG